MTTWVMSETGNIRENNEDAAYGNVTTGFFVIADGMGGHEAGEIASSMAVEKIRIELEDAADVTDRTIEEAIRETNKTLYDSSHYQDQKIIMGTTLTFLKMINESTGYVGHVGDSRLYLLRNQQLMQLTEDHTYVEKLYKEGVITLDEYKMHPKKNVLLKALGGAGPVDPQIFTINLQPGDIIFICSDGVYNVLSDEEIASFLLQKTGESRMKTFKKTIDKKGAHDNYSFIIIDDIDFELKEDA